MLRSLPAHRGLPPHPHPHSRRGGHRPHLELQRVDEQDSQEAKPSNDDQACSSTSPQASHTCPSSASMLSETDTVTALMGGGGNKWPQTLCRRLPEMPCPLREGDRERAGSVAVEGDPVSGSGSAEGCVESVRKRRQELLVACSRSTRGVDGGEGAPRSSLSGADETCSLQDGEKRRLLQLLSAPMW